MPSVVFLIVAASAPLTVVAGGQRCLLGTGNEGIPLMFIVLGIVLALFATGTR